MTPIQIGGKPIEKLIDVVSRGIGKMYEPVHIRKMAKAEAFKIIETQKAKKIADLEKIDIDDEFLQRLENRIYSQEIRKQKNLDAVVSYSMSQLKEETSVDAKTVSTDWATRFFNIVEDISDEEMQRIWGHILSGEIKKPESYSLRTLELLKNLSKKEAMVFLKFCDFVVLNVKSGYIIFDSNDDNDLIRILGLNYDDIFLLEELNLISTTIQVLNFYYDDNENERSLTYGNETLVVELTKEQREFDLSCISLTTIGFELYKLSEHKFNNLYFESIKTKISFNGIKYKSIASSYS